MMSQVNHSECWVTANDPPRTGRRVIIWTKKPWLPKREFSRHLDIHAWYDRKQKVWFHSDGTVAKDVTRWMEIPR